MSRFFHRFLHVSRLTVDTWIRRFEAEHCAGLVDKNRGPKSPRKVWLPLMVLYTACLRYGVPDALILDNGVTSRTVGINPTTAC